MNILSLLPCKKRKIKVGEKNALDQKITNQLFIINKFFEVAYC